MCEEVITDICIIVAWSWHLEFWILALVWTSSIYLTYLRSAQSYLTSKIFSEKEKYLAIWFEGAKYLHWLITWDFLKEVFFNGDSIGFLNPVFKESWLKSFLPAHYYWHKCLLIIISVCASTSVTFIQQVPGIFYPSVGITTLLQHVYSLDGNDRTHAVFAYGSSFLHVSKLGFLYTFCPKWKRKSFWNNSVTALDFSMLFSMGLHCNSL